jgi:hypothetical protein
VVSIYYVVGFTVTSGGALPMTGTIAGTTASIAAGNYAHESMSNTLADYDDFGTAVETAFVAATVACTWNATTRTFTLSKGGVFSMSFPNTTAGQQLAAALGFVAGVTYSGAASYTSVIRPYYVIVAQEAGRSQALPMLYEPPDITEEATSDGGKAHSVSRDTDELWGDWTQPMETRAACFDRYVSGSVPWTWQAFFKHARGEQPFMVVESGVYWIYTLRADATSFHAEPVSSDWDSYFNIKIRARYLGDNT